MTRSRKSQKAARIVREAVVQLFALKLAAGASQEELQYFADQCLDRASKKISAESNRATKPDYHRIGSLLRAWHRETKYLSKDGYPRPLRLAGTPGLNELAHRFCSSDGVKPVVDSLKRGRLIRQDRSGRWIPNGKQVVVPYVSQAMFEHIAEGVARFVETVTHNITSDDKGSPLFERSAKVHKFPHSQLSEFHVFVEKQATAFLGAVDEWMELRADKATKTQGRKCEVGVFTFAFADTRVRKTRRG
jgi:hypothetical protein